MLERPAEREQQVIPWTAGVTLIAGTVTGLIVACPAVTTMSAAAAGMFSKGYISLAAGGCTP